MSMDWKQTLSELVQEHKTLLSDRQISKKKHEEDLENLFVRRLMPVLSRFADEVKKNGYQAKLDTSTRHATINTKTARGDVEVFSARFTGAASSENFNVVVGNSHKEDELIFVGTDDSTFDDQAILEYLLRQFRKAKDYPEPKKTGFA